MSTFASLGLDARLLKAMRKMGFEQPTAVQARCIPLALEGKDILARAPTGSGKTVAYALPLLQQILTDLASAGAEPTVGVRALILVPTRELCNQVHATLHSLLAYAAGVVSTAHVASDEPLEAQRARLAPGSVPHVLIATPGRLLQHLRAGSLELREGCLRLVVVDEADLLLSYGYAPDLQQVRGAGCALALGVPARGCARMCCYSSCVPHATGATRSIRREGNSTAQPHAPPAASPHAPPPPLASSPLYRQIGPLLPPCVQALLLSATLTPDLDAVSALLLHNPTTIDIGGVTAAADAADGGAAGGAGAAGGVAGKLSQYLVSCKGSDKFLLMFALLKLNRIPGKSLIFCNDVARSFRLKLFLEQFGVHCGVLNAELPLNSRWHAIQAFNKGAFDFLIATDDPVLRAADSNGGGAAGAAGAEEGAAGGAAEGGGGVKKRKKRKAGGAADGGGGQWQAEFGVSRGIDFQGVTAVINFDLPATLAVYQHRIGRTARGGLEGTSISLVASDQPADCAYAQQLRAVYGSADGGADGGSGGGGGGIKPLHVEFAKLNSFRYRVDDAVRAVTRTAVQEARLREVRDQLLNSERLRSHFEANPQDLRLLQHDKPLATVRPAPELKRIPKYLLPDRKDSVDGQLTAKMATIAHAVRKQRARHKLVGGKGSKRKADPLKSLSAGKGKHRAARAAAGKSRAGSAKRPR